MKGDNIQVKNARVNVDDFQIKAKHDHVDVTFLANQKQVAHVNFPKQDFGAKFLQQLQEAIWG